MSTKDLKIKTGVVKRTHKELIYYVKEATHQQGRIDKMTADGADEHDVRKQYEVLEETNMMLPDVKKRLAVAYKELQDIVVCVADVYGKDLRLCCSTVVLR
ncbi:tubulin binding cofactor A [Jimgerdemannia flammicorona]|uniref:Tubulin-specific chaperone A n=1 Tax=Jimgerdemannia flammicorona TaxID=994334 RepID=A0A433ADC7_9FUNG|nr:tubulin binding cofactor A [Jimgerdemannia flammicorona]